MKKYCRNGLFTVAIVCLSIVCISNFSKKATAETIKPIHNSNAMKGFALLELFTSEGCSSCPPADELIAKVNAEGLNNLFILAYHVDYWNRLGWKDVFSKPEWSARQRDYASHLSTEGVYTPQLIVNGKDEFVGSNETKLRSVLEKKTANTAIELAIGAIKKTENVVQINFETQKNDNALLNIALVQQDAITQVKRGENAGHQLHHVNIVRDLKTIELNNGNGSININIPNELVGTHFSVIGFVQQKKDFSIIAAAKADL